MDSDKCRQVYHAMQSTQIHQTTRYHVSENKYLHSYRSDNFRFHLAFA